MPKRPLMVATHLALAGVVCLLLLVHDRGDLWLLFLVTALYGLGGDVFAAARSAMLKAMVPDELLGDANGAYQSIREGLRIVAPLAGAGIFAAAGGSVVALVDAGTFVASAATLVALRFAEPAAAPGEQHLLREISAGLAHIMRTPALRELTLGLGAALLVAGSSETLIMLLGVPQTVGIAAGAGNVTVLDYRIEVAVMAAVFLVSAGYLLTRRVEVPVTAPSPA